MMGDLTIGIIASIIASLLVGGGIVYKVIAIKKKSNKGISQSEGSNQIALQKSKGNTINIGRDLNDEKKGD